MKKFIEDRVPAHSGEIIRQGFPIKIENKVVNSYFKVAKPKKVNEYATLSGR